MDISEEEFERMARERGWRPPLRHKSTVQKVLHLADGTRTRREIAEECGISYAYACMILRGYGGEVKEKSSGAVERIAALADGSLTRGEIAQKVGVCYSYVCNILRAQGLADNVPRQMDVRDIERDARICEAIKAGRTLQSVSDEYGITRERVRQIADRNGIKPKGREITSERARKRVERVRELVRSGCSLITACAVAKTSYDAVEKYAPDLIERRRESFQERVKYGIELVGGGMSIRKAARRVGISEGALQKHVAKAGIESRHGRWKGKGLAAQYVAGEMV